MKKVLFLGGSPFQLPPILYAKQKGYHVITCDYLPDNPGNKLADEYHNISTTDKEAVLALAAERKIDGIVAYASDPAAPTAAYVAEKLGLPGNPYKSVEILANKDLYRDFLSKNNFNVPAHASFSSFDEVQRYVAGIDKPVMLKPVDSSGSKGVTKLAGDDQLQQAYDLAISFSRSKRVIVEEFVERKGTQIAGDGFVLNGKLVFRCFAQEHFNRSGNIFVPIGESFPLLLPEYIQEKIHLEVERLVSLLDMKAGAINFDIVIDQNDRIFLMEIGPRAGGNLITEIIKYSTGVNLVKYIVDCSLGFDCSDLCMYERAKYYSCYILHSQKEGYYNNIAFSPSIRDNIVETILSVNTGDLVKKYENSGCGIGELILKFDSAEEMLIKMDSMHEHIKISLSGN